MILWFYWLAPWRHLNDPTWFAAHSKQQIWLEAQRRIHRLGLDHDMSILVGRFGDEAWAEWGTRRLGSAQGVDESLGCGEWPFHLPDALCYMTNQRMTNAIGGWSTWWKENGHKPQSEWIREGFVGEGIALSHPLKTADIAALLTMCGSSKRGHLVYNAERWLRDSGVRPSQIDLGSLPGDSRDRAAKGLVRYSEWLGEYWDAPGKLHLGPTQLADPRLPALFCEHPLFKAVLSLFLTGMAVWGMWLLRGARPTASSPSQSKAPSQTPP